ncbi:MAG TPA: thioesterase family protein [Candidatus Margulisiibacteriota bacterium]|nr:thioesterase family protein [Candidatus Margulisiibacteriota bacterium]
MSDSNLIEVARYRVIFADCDPMRIMYYGSYFRLFEIGRAELFRKLGHPFPEYIARGLYLGVIETHCRYVKPARYDDDLIIRAGVTEVGRARLAIGYEVTGLDGDLRANGSTLHAVLNDAGRPQRIPPEFRDAVRRHVRCDS